MNTDRIIRLAEVLHLTGLSRTTIWRAEKAARFPCRVRLGPNSVGWRYAEVKAWLDGRVRVEPYRVGAGLDP